MRLILLLFSLLWLCPCAAVMQSNLTQDLDVNTQDLTRFLEDWLVSGYWTDDHFVTSDADFNYDGIVNNEDFSILSQEWLWVEPNAPESYSNQPVTIWAGGYGYAAAYGEPVLFPGKTYGFISDRFLASGLLRRIRMRLYTDNGTSPIEGAAKLKILSGFSNPFTLRADIDITEAVNLAKQTVDSQGRFTLEYDCLPHGLTVTNSDFIAAYFPEHICFVRTTEVPCPSNEQVLCNWGGDITEAAAVLDHELCGYSYIMDFRIDSPEFIIFDNKSPIASPACIELPYYEKESQYIILENVYIPYSENLKIDLCQTFDDGDDRTLNSITLNDTISGRYIDFDGFSSNVSCNSGSRYNIHIWTDPQQGKIEVLYYNKSIVNIQHKSLTGRSPQRMVPGRCIRRLRIHQDYGTHGSVNRIVVCRKPVLAVGDSFVSGYNGKTILSNVGMALSGSNVFSENRYVINGGISGNQVLTSTSSCSAIQIRWNNNDHDLCAYRDVIVTFVNGPGLNDISQIYASATAEQVTQKAHELAQAITKMATETLANGDEVGGCNSIVMCEMIPYTRYQETDFERFLKQKSCQEQLNSLLSEFATQKNIPIAQVYEDIPASYSDGTHPTTEGSIWIAQCIAETYEEYYSHTKKSVHLGMQ
jgi:lysophospholipase L1-like esterase